MHDDELVLQMREVRRAYDGLSPGDRAVLRRCRDAEEIVLEGAFWKVASVAAPELKTRLAHTVVCYPAAEQKRQPGRFRLGTHLRRKLHPGATTLKPAEAVRFRQLLAARDLGVLTHRLRKLLVLADAPVDWGAIGRDVQYWSDAVKRRWARDFYAPGVEEEEETDADE